MSTLYLYVCLLVGVMSSAVMAKPAVISPALQAVMNHETHDIIVYLESSVDLSETQLILEKSAKGQYTLLVGSIWS